MKRPIFANPLSESEKEELFEISNVLRNERRGFDFIKDDTVERYVAAFIKKNKLKGYVAKGTTLKKTIVSIAFSVLFVYHFLSVTAYNGIDVCIWIFGELIALLFINILLRGNMKRRLFYQVLCRPDDNIDDILIGGVREAEKRGALWIFLTLLPFFVLAFSIAALENPF